MGGRVFSPSVWVVDVFSFFTLHHGTSYKLRKTNQLCQIYKGFRNCANMQKDMQSNWN